MKISKKQIAKFAAQFSFDDWQKLCRNVDFLNAVESGAFDLAEVIAFKILNGTW